MNDHIKLDQNFKNSFVGEIIKVCTHIRINEHFRDQRWLAGFYLDSHSPVILILSILTGEAKTLRIHMVYLAASAHLH